MKDLINRQAAIDIEGLDEQIRCEMCRNPMHTDRGCDGYCRYDEKLYERIMHILDERIKPLSSAQSDQSTDIQAILQYLDNVIHPLVSPENWNVYSELHDMISNLTSAQPRINNQINLCDSCKYLYPACPSEEDDVLYGNGIGNDNICACNKYDPLKTKEDE